MRNYNVENTVEKLSQWNSNRAEMFAVIILLKKERCKHNVSLSYCKKRKKNGFRLYQGLSIADRHLGIKYT